MTWLWALRTTCSYLLLPLRTIFGWLLAILAPVIYLGRYITSALLLPLGLCARLETVYIYFGVAATIGLIFATILHISSSILVYIFDLAPRSPAMGRTAASVRASQENKKLQQAWHTSIAGRESNASRKDDAINKYAQWLEKDMSQRRDEQGILSQTILEEEDSEDAF